MLESSFGLNFFMKTPEKETSYRYSTLELRWMVCGRNINEKEWDPNRWHQKSERATGSKEDGRYADLSAYAVCDRTGAE